jgi:hypothetical protein
MSWRVVRKKLLQYFARQGLVSSSVDGELLARVCAFLSELPFSDVDVIFIDSGRIDQLLGTPINCMFYLGLRHSLSSLRWIRVRLLLLLLTTALVFFLGILISKKGGFVCLLHHL